MIAAGFPISEDMRRVPVDPQAPPALTMTKGAILAADVADSTIQFPRRRFVSTAANLDGSPVFNAEGASSPY